MARRSNVERLPEEYREQLNAMVRDPRINQTDVAPKINAILEADGLPDRVSKSGVNRYCMKMEKAGEKLRHSREVAKMWIAKLGAAPQGQVGHLINEVLRTMAFDMSLHLQEGEITEKNAPATVKMLKGLALTMQRLEKAASENVKREEQIRKQALEDAAKAAGKTAKQAGISDATINAIRRDVLRMSN